MNPNLAALQGEWRIESLQVDGASLPPTAFAAARVTLEGDRFVSIGMGAVYEGRASVGDGPGPFAFTIAFEAGPELGVRNHGIAALDDEHGWRLCLNMRGGPAPTGFSTSPGDGCAFETLRRA